MRYDDICKFKTKKYINSKMKVIHMKRIKITITFLSLLGILLFSTIISNFNSTKSLSNSISSGNYILDDNGELVPFSAQAEKKWTIMVYLDGDNNLEEAALDDLNEMEMVGSSADVDIVVQLDRIGGYDDSNYNWDETRRYHVEKDTSQSIIGEPVATVGEINMGSKEALEDFINWSQITYPAENYALILWDHGSGPMWGPYLGGICWDDSNNNDFLTQEEIRSSILGKNINLLGMDACLMGSTEVILGLHDLVDVFVASEENEPGDGWSYDLFLQALIDDPTMSAEELGEIIVQKYYDYYLPYVPYGFEVTQSAISSSMMNSVSQTLSELALDLIDQISLYRSSIKIIRESMHAYGGSPYIDLYTFLLNIESEGILTSEVLVVKNALDQAIISSKFTGSLEESKGLTIYFPESAEDFSNLYKTSYFGQNSFWDEFLLAYYAAPIGDDQFEDNDLPTSAKYLLFKEYVGLICNDTDYYKFNVTTGDNLSLYLEYSYNSDVSDINLYLYDENETMIDSSISQTNFEFIGWTADINQTISVKINNTHGNGYMVMYSFFASVPIEDDHFDTGSGNNNFTTATNMNTDLGDNNETYSNLVCINPDYYVFWVSTKDAYVSVLLEYIAVEGVLGLDIIEYNTNTLKNSTIRTINTPDDNAFTTFCAQNFVNIVYFVLISNYEDNPDYNLTITLDYDIDDSYDDNNPTDNDHPSSSNSVIPRVNQIYTDLVCIDYDFYNISLVENEWLNATIIFDQIEGDLDLYLYGPHTNWSSPDPLVLASSYYWENSEMITFICPENGTYSLLVNPREVNLNYNMSIVVNETGLANDPYDGSNERWDQHESFPGLNLEVLYQNLAGWDEDWYSINLIPGEEIIISLIYDNFEGTLAIFLYDSLGNNIVSTYNHLYYQSSLSDIFYIQIVPYQRISEYHMMVIREPDFNVEFSTSLTDSLLVDFKELVIESYYIDYFIWNFGDGTYYLGNNANLTHLYSEPGHYPVSLTLWTKYGKGFQITEYVDVYSTPEDGFLLYLNGTNPLSNATFDIYWNPLVNAQNLSIYYSVSDTVPIEDWALLQADPSGNAISITLTLQQSGTYYLVVKYSNPFGTAVSEILLVEIQLENDPDNTGGILDFIPGYNAFLLIGTCSVVSVYLFNKKKK